ncbi:asparaginase domain-containing protein [Kibdelosporangium persicum]|uniref:L-asparaginase/GlutRNAGln amidotransferase subunit D n=1 Tax=Kibdelosporangium persicum TaxID=2698649 RepID=A0ABX2EZ63_9PSEU|nr:asparaginase domain-containing protein [Kibdelosporangium persicum]NRN64267.1 L-asparaginase/GlutRNAGln amidotransferase subunit D [Kibdelosporangium persicum]
MRRVLLVATGDTMAYLRDPPGMATGSQLLCGIAYVPGAGVTVEDVLAEPSWDTSPGTMLTIARRARAALLEGFDGVVITHGVDTLEETAFLTELVVGHVRGAVVFTGATSPFDAPGSDGPPNLTTAIAAAADPAVDSTVVCFNGELHAARWVRLATATSFESGQVLGRVGRQGVTMTAAPPPRLPEIDGVPETDVALIKTYPGMPPSLLTAATDAGARGIVLEGTGSGNVPVELFIPISELTEWDIPVVIASRARTPDMTSLAAKVGAISARGLSPGHARIALMAALSEGGVHSAREWFDHLLG